MGSSFGRASNTRSTTFPANGRRAGQPSKRSDSNVQIQNCSPANITCQRRAMVRFAFFVSLLFGGSLAQSAEPTGKALPPVVKVVEGGESRAKPEDCRAKLVGP